MAPGVVLHQLLLLELQQFGGCLLGLDAAGDLGVGQHQVVVQVVFGHFPVALALLRNDLDQLGGDLEL